MYALTTILSAVSALVVSVRAAPMLMAPLAAVQITGRDVVAPPITSPNASLTWQLDTSLWHILGYRPRAVDWIAFAQQWRKGYYVNTCAYTHLFLLQVANSTQETRCRRRRRSW